ncbi:hypothetical protein H0H92_004253 [Tricholoma furcatifolium]|nr:hypothetical protein H0H92_004253 [Tricholoma furcatifolium]
MEILVNVFQQVVEDADSVENDTPDIPYFPYMNQQPMDQDWVPLISHVCSHWREVALSTPRLWSTIHVESRARALEMLKRSKDLALSVKSYNMFYHEMYDILYHILASDHHRLRIKDLVVGLKCRKRNRRITDSPRPLINTQELSQLLELLAQTGGPLKIQRLEINADRISHSHNPIGLLDDAFTSLRFLKHLSLVGFAFNWKLLQTFESLKTFNISGIPYLFQPSAAQLLRLLSRMPVLESLSIAEMADSPREILPSHHVDRISMKFLTHIDLFSPGCASINYFFDHVLLFLKDKINLQVRVPDAPGLGNLAQKMDDATDGLISELSAGKLWFHCWKSKGRKLASFSELPPLEPPVIKLTCVPPTAREFSADLVTAFRALRLDQLTSLEMVDDHARSRHDMDSWIFFGNLPSIVQLKVHNPKSGNALSILCSGMDVEQSDLDTVQAALGPDSQPAFPALTNLVIKDWDFWETIEGRQQIMTVKKLFDCVKLRAEANLPIKILRIERCCVYEGEERNVSNLRNLVDVVDWDERDYEF